MVSSAVANLIKPSVIWQPWLQHTVVTNNEGNYVITSQTCRKSELQHPAARSHMGLLQRCRGLFCALSPSVLVHFSVSNNTKQEKSVPGDDLIALRHLQPL